MIFETKKLKWRHCASAHTMVTWDNNYYHDNHLIVKCENTMLNSINHTMIYSDNSVIYL